MCLELSLLGLKLRLLNLLLSKLRIVWLAPRVDNAGLVWDNLGLDHDRLSYNLLLYRRLLLVAATKNINQVAGLCLLGDERMERVGINRTACGILYEIRSIRTRRRSRVIISFRCRAGLLGLLLGQVLAVVDLKVRIMQVLFQRVSK